MRESQRSRAKTTALGGLVIFLLLTRATSSVARPCPCVNVGIEAESHVWPLDTSERTIFLRLKLTYHIPATRTDKRIALSISPGPANGGAGLVVEHVTPSGTKTTQNLDPEPWWFSKVETLEVKSSSYSTSFNVWARPGMSFDFSELGIYRISYVHPQAEQQEDRDSLLFRSNTLTIACVTQERYDQLSAMLYKNTDLAFASYRFKNPPSAREDAKYRRSVANIIDEAIANGSKQDKVLVLLGSPDGSCYRETGEGQSCDEEWLYETSPVGGYSVHFKNGSVVWKGKVFDSDSP
jgi:hypothetical protein